MKRCVDCDDILTELDFGLHCLECNEERLLTSNPNITPPGTSSVYLAPIRPDPRPWGVDDAGGNISNQVRGPVPADAP